MSGFLLVALAVALLAVLAVLFTGVIGLARGGEFNRKYGNKLMRLRVLLQFAALGIILLLFLLSGR
ncbi:MAG: twin transmembrane helix small protein [Alphaproteobacteria bacterium]|nr:twin transmembrane helix small protein [Alphaproteobacteria bacterium]